MTLNLKCTREFWGKLRAGGCLKNLFSSVFVHFVHTSVLEWRLFLAERKQTWPPTTTAKSLISLVSCSFWLL